MTIHLPEDLTNSIRTEVLSGHFASEDEVVAAAVRDYLRRKHEQARQSADAAAAGHLTQAEQQPTTQELQRRLFEAGVLNEMKPPITDLAPYRNRQAVPIQGEPLSETVIRERR
jgi:Arc/MetJ-type ribon-helix-helix transcriptional regulator